MDIDYGKYAQSVGDAIQANVIGDEEDKGKIVDAVLAPFEAEFTRMAIQKTYKKYFTKAKDGAKKVVKKKLGLDEEESAVDGQEEKEAIPTEEEQYQSALGQPARTAPEDYGGTPLEDLGPQVQTELPPTQEQAIQQSTELQAQQRAPTQEDVPEGGGEIQGEMGRPVGGGEGSSEGFIEGGDAEGAADATKALSTGEKLVSGGIQGELDADTAASAAADESGVGIIVTAALGIAALFASIFSHSKPPPVQAGFTFGTST